MYSEMGVFECCEMGVFECCAKRLATLKNAGLFVSAVLLLAKHRIGIY